jgi:ankyrin repeat protein
MGQSLDTMLCEAADAGDLATVETAITGLGHHGYTATEEMIPAVDKGRLFGKTALMLAAANGHIEVVEALLQHGAHVDATRKMYCPVDNPQYSKRENIGWTGLMDAADRGHEELVSMLLAAGAAPNAESADGTTALLLAAVVGHAGIVKLLLGAGAGVDGSKRYRFSPGSPGVTPIMLAICRGHVMVVEQLIDAGADVCWHDRGSTVFMYSINCPPKSCDDILSLLMQAGAGRVLDVVQDDGRRRSNTALSLAASCNKLQIVQFLVDAGADVNFRPVDLSSMIQARSYDFDMHRTLSDAGAFFTNDLFSAFTVGEDDIIRHIERQLSASALYGVTSNGSVLPTLACGRRVSWDAECSVLVLQHMRNYAWRRRKHAAWAWRLA